MAAAYRSGVLCSGGSDDGGSEPTLGLSGVRKGDLNGFFNVLVASFSLRRLACGVDIPKCTAALRVVCARIYVREKAFCGGFRCLLVGDAWLMDWEESATPGDNQIAPSRAITPLQLYIPTRERTISRGSKLEQMQAHSLIPDVLLQKFRSLIIRHWWR